MDGSGPTLGGCTGGGGATLGSGAPGVCGTGGVFGVRRGAVGGWLAESTDGALLGVI
jgi:hypothetical protein